LEVLKTISETKEDHVFDLQISHYPDDDMNYLVLSSATKDPFREHQYRSISIGLLINKQLQKKLSFLKDSKIKSQDVGVTCERCAIADCKVRQARPVLLERKNRNKQIEQVVADLQKRFG
jgi:hypothetical protein